MAKRLPPAMRPANLGPRGEIVWAQYKPTDGSDIGRALLAAQAARLTDRLDVLNDLLTGSTDAWARIRLPRNESEMVLRIDNAVSEERQASNVLRQIIAKLDEPVASAEQSGGKSAAPTSAAESGRSAIASIVNRHADGGAGAQAS